MSKNYYIANYQNRRELFKKYYHWALKTNDCDSNLFLMNYVNKRQEHNIEQRFWWAWLYANTYNAATAFIMFNEFPDFENVDIDRLTKWNAKNYKNLNYEVDCKWNKNHLPSMFASYRENVYKRSLTQKQYFDSLCTGDSTYNFYTLQNEITKNWHKFGRYLTFFYLQTLKETCDLDIEPQDLLLKEDSSESHKKGLCYALGLDELLDEENKQIFKSKETNQMLDEEADLLMKELKYEYKDVEFDYFTMETALCATKKFFREKHSRYLGYYIHRQGENIVQCEAGGWTGIDWNLLHQARQECLDKRLLSNTIDKSRFGELIRTGTMKHLDWF